MNFPKFSKDLKKVVWDYWKALREEFKIDNFGVIIADSRVQPLRKGTIGIAIATAGFEPIEDQAQSPSLLLLSLPFAAAALILAVIVLNWVRRSRE